MQRYIAVCKAARFPRSVQRIAPLQSAVYRYKNVFAARCLPKAHAVAQPAFYPAALVVIWTRAFLGIVVAALKAVDIKIPHVAAYFFKILYKLAVSHADFLLKKIQALCFRQQAYRSFQKLRFIGGYGKLFKCKHKIIHTCKWNADKILNFCRFNYWQNNNNIGIIYLRYI